MKIEAISFISANTVRVKNKQNTSQNFGICRSPKMKILAPVFDSFTKVKKTAPARRKAIAPVNVKNKPQPCFLSEDFDEAFYDKCFGKTDLDEMTLIADIFG